MLSAKYNATMLTATHYHTMIGIHGTRYNTSYDNSGITYLHMRGR